MKSLPSLLSGMGFAPGQVVETIITTKSLDGASNAAPMGVWVRPGHLLVIRPYTETKTANNLSEIPEAVINITDDPRIFFSTAFKEEIMDNEKFWFEPAKHVSVQRLRGMLAYVEISVEPSTEIQPDQDSQEFECRVHHVDAPTRLPAVYSRARFAAIECVIHATRIRALHDIDPVITEKLLASIQDYYSLVKRIAPNSVSAGVIDDILQLIQKWVYWL
ncbi:MAG: DUF447 domain-containing protein [Promethearchaeota archaeon]